MKMPRDQNCVKWSRTARDRGNVGVKPIAKKHYSARNSEELYSLGASREALGVRATRSPPKVAGRAPCFTGAGS